MSIGKIAKLPREIREQLNQRLADGEPGIRLVDWLNSLREVRAGLAISAQNLTNWKQNGYQDWFKRKQVREFCTQAVKIPEARPTLEDLTTLMVAQYAVMFRHKLDLGGRREWREWRIFCHDVLKFRRKDYLGERMELDLKKMEFQKEKLRERREVMADRVVQVLVAMGISKGADGRWKIEDGVGEKVESEKRESRNELIGSQPRGGDGPSPLHIETPVNVPPLAAAQRPVVAHDAAVGPSSATSPAPERGERTRPLVKSQVIGNQPMPPEIKVNQGGKNKKNFASHRLPNEGGDTTERAHPRAQQLSYNSQFSQTSSHPPTVCWCSLSRCDQNHRGTAFTPLQYPNCKRASVQIHAGITNRLKRPKGRAPNSDGVCRSATNDAYTASTLRRDIIPAHEQFHRPPLQSPTVQNALPNFDIRQNATKNRRSRDTFSSGKNACQEMLKPLFPLIKIGLPAPKKIVLKEGWFTVGTQRAGSGDSPEFKVISGENIQDKRIALFSADGAGGGYRRGFFLTTIQTSPPQ